MPRSWASWARAAISENLAVYAESTDFERYAAPIGLVE
jgi:hypothetical protein